MDRLSADESLRFVEGAYRTVPGGRSVPARIFPGARFYSRVARIVWRAGRAASRGNYDDEAWRRSSLDVFRAFERVGGVVEIEGVDRFSGIGGPCVFIGNHMSTLETFLLPSIIVPSKRVTYVVKRSLVEYPVFGHVMRSRDPIVVGRTNPREDLTAVLEGGAGRLGEGISIVVFPQTTRTEIFDPAAFNSIGIKLAKRARVPVVPVALKTDAWGNGRLFKDFGKIDPARVAHFAFGQPLLVQGSGADEHQLVIDFIREHLRMWGGKVAPAPVSAGH
jgi:1-acyl-sn-glycerol-3-phosphate acyltransferase